jgi:hypothetical protein
MCRAKQMFLVLLVLFFGCGNTNQPDVTAQAATDLDPDDPSILMRPFTAEEIRDEWVPGFRVLMRRTFPEETRIERWTVVSADDDGVDIEYATVADDGSVEGEPSVSRSGWTELRDHAAFPAAHSTREWISRDTALGQFEGWLYRVAEPGADVVKEFFFVPELPGAPVQMHILEGDATVFALEQTARLRPDVD